MQPIFHDQTETLVLPTQSHGLNAEVEMTECWTHFGPRLYIFKYIYVILRQPTEMAFFRLSADQMK